MRKQMDPIKKYTGIGALLHLTFPIILMTALESVYSLVDGIVVSYFDGAHALAAIQIVFPLLLLLNSIGYLFGFGVESLVHLKMKLGDTKKANRLMSGGYVLTAAVTLILSGIILIFDHEIYYFLGAKDEEDARKYVEEGDPIHLHTYHQEMINGFLTARAIDDRGGVFIVMEALKRAKERGCKIGVYAASTVGEETTGRGANWAAHGVQANAAIVVDVTYATDVPGTKPEESGSVKLGKGPVICNSSLCNKKLNDMLKTCGKEKEIPYQVESFIGRTSTDGDTIHLAGTGTTTALVSLPLRYMHNPCEMCSLQDVENAIELIAEFLCRVDENMDFDPFK